MAPSKACIEEAQRLYRTARKLRRAVAAIEERLALTRNRLLALEAAPPFRGHADGPQPRRPWAQALRALQIPAF